MENCDQNCLHQGFWRERTKEHKACITIITILKLSLHTWFLIPTKSSQVLNFNKKKINIMKENIKLRLLTRQQLKFMRVHFAVNWPSTIRNLAFWFRIVTAGARWLANELSIHWWIRLFIKPLGNLKGTQGTCSSSSGKWNLRSLDRGNDILPKLQASVLLG